MKRPRREAKVARRRRRQVDIPRQSPLRVVFAFTVALLLLGTGLASAWVLVTSGMFAEQAATLDGPLAGAQVAAPDPIEIGDGARVLFNAQLSQPRDPFRPLIDESTPPGGLPGVGGPFDPTTGDGTPGDDDFAPNANAVALLEVRDVDGVLRATVTVGGETYEVGVGDTFAGIYKVVSLSPDSGVFLKGDSVFQLDVGQQILK